MKWNDHDRLVGTHAFLSPSQYHWINYDDDKLIERYNTKKAAEEGTELHAIAEALIRKRIKLPSRSNKTLNLYVNDAIGFHMRTEQCLYYSDNCFGHADAISFINNCLRIHDLKTGTVPAHMEQLEIYAALFCIEYKKDPNDIDIELRIYQSNQVMVHNPEKTDILYIMDKIKRSDSIIKELEEEASQ